MAFLDAFKQFPELQTERLHLRQLQVSNAAAYLAGISTVDRTIWGLQPDSVEDAERFLEVGRKAYANKAHLRWGVFRKEELVGEARLFDFVYQSKAELSYWIASSHRRQGLAREAVAAVVEFGFDVLELHRIEAVVHPDNLASLALMERLGLQREGLLRKARNEGGRSGVWNDAVIFGRLWEEFKGNS